MHTQHVSHTKANAPLTTNDHNPPNTRHKRTDTCSSQGRHDMQGHSGSSHTPRQSNAHTADTHPAYQIRRSRPSPCPSYSWLGTGVTHTTPQPARRTLNGARGRVWTATMAPTRRPSQSPALSKHTPPRPPRALPTTNTPCTERSESEGIMVAATKTQRQANTTRRRTQQQSNAWSRTAKQQITHTNWTSHATPRFTRDDALSRTRRHRCSE